SPLGKLTRLSRGAASYRASDLVPWSMGCLGPRRSALWGQARITRDGFAAFCRHSALPLIEEQRARADATGNSALTSRPQTSGLSAVGTAASSPGNHWVFSAQTNSTHSTSGRPYVMVADQGIVKAPSSSTVNWSCKYLSRLLVSLVPIAT